MKKYIGRLRNKFRSAKARNKSLIKKARKFRKQGEIELEAQAWKEAFEQNQKDFKSAVAYIKAIRKLQRKEEALQESERITKLFPEEAAAWSELAKNFINTDPEIALKWFKKAFELDPKHTYSKKQLLRLLLNFKRYDEAVPIAEAVAKNDKDQHVSFIWAALVLVYAGKTERGLALFTEAIERFKGKDEIMQPLGLAWLNQISLAQEEIGKDGKLTPVSLSHRPAFLAEPERVRDILGAMHFYEAICKSMATKKRKRARGSTASKILFVSDGNWNFMQGMVEEMDANPDYQVKTLEFQDIPKECRFDRRNLIGHIIVSGMTDTPLPELDTRGYHFREYLDWADVIFVEWANYPAMWLSWLAEVEAQIIVRLHSYEAFTFWPHLINWNTIDDVVFIARHIKGFLSEQLPMDSYNVRQHVIPNHNNLDRYHLPKKEGSSRKIGLIGYNNLNKNPLMALQILNKLLDRDSSWKLILIGHHWPEEIKREEEATYFEAYSSYLSKERLTSHVEYYGFTDKLEAAMQEFDFVLSTSEREGTHESVIQAMASGCVPVVRNWPMVSKWGGAKNIYEAEWIFESVDEAVTMIQKYTVSDTFTEKSYRARKQALNQYNHSVMMPKLIELLGQ